MRLAFKDVYEELWLNGCAVAAADGYCQTDLAVAHVLYPDEALTNLPYGNRVQYCHHAKKAVK